MKTIAVYHPLEFIRRISCFLKDLDSDMSLRFPETRRRHAIEIQLLPGHEKIPNIDFFVQRMEKSQSLISVFDWPVLLEFNERRLLIASLSAINLRAVDFNASDLSATQEKIGEVLNVLSEEIREALRDTDWGFWRSLILRWRFSAAREEIQYYLKRWDETKRVLESKAV
jgi:hypothetical protein